MIDTAAFIQRLSRTKLLSPKIVNTLIEGVRINTFDAQ